MSLNGLYNTQFPLTLDGTTSLDVSSLTIDGLNVDLTGYVPYVGATQTLNMGAQNIQTTHAPVAGSDVVNLTTLTNAVTYVDNSNALTYLNKITTSSVQTVAGPTTFSTGLTCDYVTSSKVPVFDANKKIVSSGVDAIKVTYLANVSSDLQTQLNALSSNKADTTYVDTQLALKADLSYVNSQNAAQDVVIGTKASQSYVDTQLATKADLSYVNSQNSAQDAVIATKANTADVNSALSLKASISYVDSKNDAQDIVIATKANTADVNNALALKADVTYVNSQNSAQDAVIATKANTTDVNNALALKADVSYVNSQNSAQDAVIATKANTTDVNNALALKSDLTYVNQEIATLTAIISTKADASGTSYDLSLKADITYVDAQNNTQNTVINSKANTTDVNNALALKADTSYVNSQNAAQDAVIATKANTTDVNNALALKADTSYVNSQNAAQDAVIALKANTSDVNSALSLKASIAYVDSKNDAQDIVIATKASTTDVNNALALKADVSYVNSQNSAQDAVIATKASTSYVDSQDATLLALINTKANNSSLTNYLPLSGGTLTGALICNSTFNCNSTATVNTRLLGVPDGSGSGNFWIGLTGTGSEVDRLAIAIGGNQTTGAVSNIGLGKPVSLGGVTASRALITNGSSIITASATTSTELGYLSGTSSSVQTQLNDKASSSYVNSQDALRVLKAGDTMTGDLKNTGGEFWPYKGGDLNRSCRLFANDGDGAEYSSYNGGLKSWYGIAFYCSYDDTVRHVLNTRDGSSKQTGQIECGSLTTAGTITTTGTGTSAGVLAKRYYLSARGDNQDEKTADNVFGPWYGLGESGIPGFTGNPCLAGYYGVALRSALGYIVVTQTGNVGIGSTNPGKTLTVTGDCSVSGEFYAAGLSAKNWWRQNDYRSGMKPSDQTGGTMGYYFGTMANNNTGAYSDMLCLNGWSDSSAGSVNLIMYSKSGSGIRQYQGDYGSATAFSTYYDCVMTDANSANVGLTGRLSIGLNSTALPNIKFSNAQNHISGTATEAWLFTGYNGHIAIGRNATRDADTVNLMLGVASTEEAQIISRNTNDTAYKTLAFASSRYTFTSGGVCVAGDNPYALQQGYMKKGTLTMGSSTENYGGGTNWNTDTAGLMMECLDHTEFAVHDGGTRVASFMYYSGNVFQMGRNMGWGTSDIRMRNNLYVDTAIGVGTQNPSTLMEAIGAGTLIGARNPTGGDNYCAIRIGNNQGFGAYFFINSSERSADGGFSTATLRNDLGDLRLQSSGGNGFTIDASSGYTRKYGGDNSKILFGPNATWGAYLVVGAGGNEATGNKAQILSTNGNLHADAGLGKDIYIGYYPWTAGQQNNIRLYGPMYIINPPQQYRGAQAGFGSLLGWDIYDSRVTINVVEYYHSGPYNNYLQVAWNGLNRTSQLYKSSQYQCLKITGYVTAWRNNAGFMDVQIRLYNQSTGVYYYYNSYVFHNVAGNHAVIPVNIDVGQIPAGWYDVYLYFVSGGQNTDANDFVSLTYELWPNGVTSG